MSISNRRPSGASTYASGLAGPPCTRYEDDLYSWVEDQVALLRAGRLAEIDAENVAEELADLGSEQFDKLESALTVIMLHLLKWDGQPERRSRSWDNSIEAHREHVRRVLRENPGLRSRLPEALADGYTDARVRASTEMDCDRDSLPAECPFTWDDVMTRECRFEPAPFRGRRRR